MMPKYWLQSLRPILRSCHTLIFMAEGVNAKAISPEKLVDALIAGLKKNTLNIRVGDTKAIYYLSRFLPKIAWGLINKVENAKHLQN